jgi:hypothetical protein
MKPCKVRKVTTDNFFDLKAISENLIHFDHDSNRKIVYDTKKHYKTVQCFSYNLSTRAIIDHMCCLMIAITWQKIIQPKILCTMHKVLSYRLIL